MVSPLQIHILARSFEAAQGLGQRLNPERYAVHTTTAVDDCLAWLRDHRDQLDCLILEAQLFNEALLHGFVVNGVLVPTVILMAKADAATNQGQGDDRTPADFATAYHSAVVPTTMDASDPLEGAITSAIQRFLELSADSCALPDPALVEQIPIPDLLSAQQSRLMDKLKARLGYLGVYYKRNPENFLRSLNPEDRKALLEQLKADYRSIILSYFADDARLNQTIDAFVDQAFLADISVSYIVEIHMNLMDELSKQLKLEGRSEEILLDYRLTLIDIIAHLCEMYRRSIPRQP
ncbi:MAG: circadian clock protein KaiA [Nodosilinea sp.]